MSFKNGKKQMMEIEISFGKGRSDHVLVHYGDDPYELATTFVKRHGLKEGSISTIGSYLDSTIHDFCMNNPDGREMSDSFDSQHDVSFDYDNVPVRFNTEIDSYAKNITNIDVVPVTSKRRESPPLRVSDLFVPVVNAVSSTSVPLSPSVQNNKRHNSTSSTTHHHTRSHGHSGVDVAEVTQSPNSPSDYTVRHGVSSSSTPQHHHVRSHSHNGVDSVLASVHTPEHYLTHDGSSRSHGVQQSLSNKFGQDNDTVKINTSAKSNNASRSTESAIPTYSPSDLALLDTLSGGDIDHKQFQESLDRNMNANLKSFSYHKIATELVSSSTKQRSLSGDQRQLADSSRNNGHGYSDGIASTDSHRSGKLPLQTNSASTRYYADAHNSEIDQFGSDIVRHASNAVRSGGGEVISNMVASGTNKNTLSTNSFDAHLTSFNAETTPNQRPSKQQQRIARANFEDRVVESNDNHPSRLEVSTTFRPVRSATVDGGSYDSSSSSSQNMYLSQRSNSAPNTADSYDSNEDSTRGSSSRRTWESATTAIHAEETREEQKGEEMYNRMRNSTRQYIAQLSSADQYNRHSLDDNNGPTLLRPHKTSLEMGNNKSLNSQSWTQRAEGKPPSLAGKTANERLYLTANIIKDKQQFRQQKAAKELDHSLTANQFKLNPASRKIVEKLGVRGYTKTKNGMDSEENHIGLRLHAEGMKERAMKEKRAANMRGVVSHTEEWSCAKCGTYHKISSANLVIQPLNQVVGDAANNAEQLQNKVVKICKTCGWDQGAVEDHKPINIGLALHDDPSAVLNTRRTGYEGIHDYLYSNAQQRDKILLLNKALHEESVDHVFKPTIPEASRVIIDKHRSRTSAAVISDSSTSSVSETSKKQKNKADSKPSLSEYVNIPVIQRLAKPLSRHLEEPNTLYKTQQHSAPPGVIVRSSYDKNQPLVLSTDCEPLPSKTDQFLQRMVYEYKGKDEKIREAGDALYSHDMLTGQPLFQPVVRELPPELYGVTVSTTAASASGQQRNAVQDILLRDELLKQKKLRAQETALRRVLTDMKEHQIRALDNSEAILKAATERNIEELFRILQQHSTVNTQMNSSVYSGSGDSSDYRVVDNDDFLYSANTEEKRSSQEAGNNNNNEEEVDLLWVSGDLMIEEVGQLLRDIKYERYQQIQETMKNSSETTPPTSLLVNFTEFRKLALKCIRKKDGGTGKAYVYAPKKRPELAVAMIRQNQQQETFKPVIDKTSKELSQSRQKELQEQPIELILQAEGVKVRNKMEAARQEQILKEAEELTFKPRMFRPPSYIRARYKNVDDMKTTAESVEGFGYAKKKAVIDSKDFLANLPLPPPPSKQESLQQSQQSQQQQQQPIHMMHNNPPPPCVETNQRGGAVRVESAHDYHESAVDDRQRSNSIISALSSHSVVSAQSGTASAVHKSTTSHHDDSMNYSTLSVRSSLASVSINNKGTMKSRPNISKPTTTGIAVEKRGGVNTTAKKPLPLLPCEMMAQKNVTHKSKGKDSDDSGHTKPSSRLSLDSGVTHSTSSTIIKKKN